MQQTRFSPLRKNNRTRLAALLILLFIAFHNSSFADEFKLVKTDRQIRLYEREVDFQQTRVREVKAEFVIQTSPEKIIGLIKDEKQFPNWNKHVANFKILPGSQPGIWTAYTRYDLPFPFSDQETLLRYEVLKKQADPTWSIQFESVTSGHFPLKQNISRIKHVKGSWQLEKVNANLYKITYSIQSERKTEIPKSISDPIVRDNLLASLHRMKSILEH